MDDLSIYDFKTNTFSVWDYVVFGGVLAISASIGIYYGCTGGKQKTTSEFLMADRKMHLLPVTLSLLASFMSAITLLVSRNAVWCRGQNIRLSLFYCTNVTGFNKWISVLLVGIVCTFYTTIGGMKAVMWTDSFQICMMFAGLIAVLVKGSIDEGGFGNIWRYMEEGERIEFWE
ncbi:hypothetical protein LSH36_515g02001 [Paralvinella palmiformis]|uniref:Sodium-dependent multivitamin transporter n=1 Tax=Paralvinella palmiformis TaxID=53620 RepID=A0AAD9J8E0_9ANNE|nr:hypothetical protein LSH36_515g02001 [Paralvinella palmiformis]